MVSIFIPCPKRIFHFHPDSTHYSSNPSSCSIRNCSTKLFTYLFVHTNGGKKALLDPVSLLPDYKGWAVHDCWASYFKFDECSHAICGAHLLRGLEGLIDRDSLWAKEMHTLLLGIYIQTERDKSVFKNPQKYIRMYSAICRKVSKVKQYKRWVLNEKNDYETYYLPYMSDLLMALSKSGLSDDAIR